MRKLILLAVLLGIGLALLGCRGTGDAHDMFTQRNARLAHLADRRSLVDDIQTNILMDDRASHLSFFYQE